MLTHFFPILTFNYSKQRGDHIRNTNLFFSTIDCSHNVLTHFFLQSVNTFLSNLNIKLFKAEGGSYPQHQDFFFEQSIALTKRYYVSFHKVLTHFFPILTINYSKQRGDLIRNTNISFLNNRLLSQSVITFLSTKC